LNNSIRTAKSTQRFSITKNSRFLFFTEIIPVYIDNHTKPTNTKCRWHCTTVTTRLSRVKLI